MALASPPTTPPEAALTQIPSHLAPATTFDIVTHYDSLVKSDASLTPPIAAIESLIALLTHTPLTTVSETLALLSHQGHVLLRAQLNPIPLSAGTDLFQRYLISSFQQRSSAHTDFSTLRSKLVANSKLFLSRAKTFSRAVASNSLPFITDDSTIFAYSQTPILSEISQHAINKGRYFNLINLHPGSAPLPPPTSTPIPTSTIPISSFPSALSSLSPTQQQTTTLLISCLSVFSNGSLLAPLGTHLLAQYASSIGIPIYCCVESFNFVRAFPMGTDPSELRRLGVKQDILRLQGGVVGAASFRKAGEDDDDEDDDEEEGSKTIRTYEDMVEIVPSSLITALVTETGVMTPSAVSEELIKLWF